MGQTPTLRPRDLGNPNGAQIICIEMDLGEHRGWHALALSGIEVDHGLPSGLKGPAWDDQLSFNSPPVPPH